MIHVAPVASAITGAAGASPPGAAARSLVVAVTVFPDFGATTGAGSLGEIVGALLMMLLAGSVGTVLVCAVVWAMATSTGNGRAAGRARAGLLVAVAVAVVAGGAGVWVNWLIALGSRL